MVSDYAGKKFEVGKVYEATTYRGNKKYYLVVKRAPSGYITFEDVTYTASGITKRRGERFARIPSKGWDFADERVTIKKGTYGGVCWTGGYSLYARNEVKSVPRRK